MPTENLIDSTRSILTPDIIKDLGMALNEPDSKVHADLLEILPTFLNGLIEEGSTKRGAKKIAELLKSDHPSLTFPPKLRDQNYLLDGEKVAEDLFGENYNEITAGMIPPSGLKTKNLEKMMGFMAPFVLGIIGTIIKPEGLTTSQITTFFNQQKKIVDVSDYFGHKFFRQKKQIPFASGILFVTFLIASFIWMVGRRYPSVSEIQTELNAIEQSVNPRSALMTVNQLPLLLQKNEIKVVPQRFYFESLSFIPGSTDLTTKGEDELNLVASLLHKYPKMMIRIEAFIEDTGDPEENLLLSENRSMLVREELIGRDIGPSRIKAVGRGPKIQGGQVYLVIDEI